MKNKPWILPVFLGGTLSIIYVLPQVGAVAQSAVKMDLPSRTRGWQFQPQPASQEELGVLSKDTRFSKATCYAVRPGEYNDEGNPVPDILNLSIVLSGSDINNSIHRPERCMPAQGHNITSSSNTTLKLSNSRQFAAKRLVSVQSQPTKDSAGRETYTKHNCLTYYFFVGHDRVTNDHLGRTFIDMKDRLVRGMDQRWAYVSVSMWYGKVPWISEKEISEPEADAKLRTFLAEFSESQIQWQQITR